LRALRRGLEQRRFAAGARIRGRHVGALSAAFDDAAAQKPAQFRGLASGFFRSALETPELPALEVDASTFTYAELAREAGAIRHVLEEHDHETEVPLTAVLAHRNSTAFAAILAILGRGHGYVPLNPAFPASRNRVMLERAGCTAIVVDSACVADLQDLLKGIERELLVVLPRKDQTARRRRELSPHRAVAVRTTGTDTSARIPVGPTDHAYLLFTSGSTGIPKGVAISHANVRAFLDAIAGRYDFGPNDRFSQTFNLTFDLSVFDMFVAWENGACLCCPSEKDLLNPAAFIRRSRLTVWFSVPSVGAFMRRLRVLKNDAFPTLRWSLFCGEALPVSVARAWANAAPNSTIENLYGPTEVTVACTAHTWSRHSADESELGLVPIGQAFGETSVRVVDPNLHEVSRGQAGELLLSGPQVARGYWRDEETTAASFISLGGARHYRTGDRVRTSEEHAELIFMGRLDNQVKVLGHRVELGEIEAAIRDEVNVDAVAAVAWPRAGASAGGVTAFVVATELDVPALSARLAKRLPPYMVPREVRLLPELPMNANGKCDRTALIRLLDST
jgi:amino acid adenylation domain-containing protein